MEEVNPQDTSDYAAILSERLTKIKADEEQYLANLEAKFHKVIETAKFIDKAIVPSEAVLTARFDI
ncbi:MAG: hypothetical protein LBC98_07635 [Prevotellaceae bacterium]|jgi:hypothetical protein|nr:hypothetical protein [Prevotellaceae bacterium]